jgi:hypothetical protein
VDNLKHWSVAIPSSDKIWLDNLFHDLPAYEHFKLALELAYKKGYQAGQDSQNNSPQVLCENVDKQPSDI